MRTKLLALVALIAVGIGAVVYALGGFPSGATATAQYLTATVARQDVVADVAATGTVAVVAAMVVAVVIPMVVARPHHVARRRRRDHHHARPVVRAMVVVLRLGRRAQRGQCEKCGGADGQGHLLHHGDSFVVAVFRSPHAARAM